ncbi:MAG: sigma 54-interacting transcriptional regulator, partial [Calditrichia bacterium]
IFPSLSLVTACNYLHVPLEKIRIIPGKELTLPGAVFPETGIIKDIHIPVNEHGEMWIYFPGRWKDNYFEPFWLENVLSWHQDESKWPEFDRKLSRRICFVGNASTKSKDTHIIPIEDNFPGVGIHAAALFTILSGNFISFSGLITNILIIIVLALLVAIISIRAPSIYSPIFHLLLLIGYVTITFLVFGKYHFNLPSMFPALTILLGGIANLSYQLLSEKQEKEFLLKEYQANKSILSENKNEIQLLSDELQKTKQITSEKLKKLLNLENKHKSVLQRIMDLEKQLDKSPSILHEENWLSDDWDELSHEAERNGIVTKNYSMLEIFKLVKKVAKSNATILILGETGTGKGNLAHAINKLSARKDKPFVTVDCGALPENLLESELFGHEKGAFTGAHKQKQGKFELANTGTIFLDELGNTSSTMQMKLLRVLQEKVIERLGGEKPIPVNVRVIAATNINLEEEMKAGRFRKDLYYRLKVILIDLPQLKERQDDIEYLAKHFIRKYIEEHGKFGIKGLSQKALEKLQQYEWPGNIRELENIIERAVVITDSNLISEKDIVFASLFPLRSADS